MSKRKPTSELNDRNWDEEEEPEEAGTFRLADQDVLKNRTIRRAKRTMPTEGASSGNIFAGFALKTSDSSVPKPPLSTGVTLNFGSNLTFQPKSNGAAQKQTGANNGDSTENPEYVRQLKVLNENILSWIQKHVRENPYCILTPSFKDYEKHLSDLERKYNIQDTKTSQDKGASAAPAVQPAAGLPELTPSMSGTGGKAPGDGFSFSQSSAEAASKSHTASDTSDTKGAGGKAPGDGFSFSQSSAEAASKSQTASDTSDTKGRGLTGTSGFSFGSAQSASVFGGSSVTQSTGLFGASSSTQSCSVFAGSGTTPSASVFGGSSTVQSSGGVGGFSFAFGAAQPKPDSSLPAHTSGEATGNGDEEYEPPKAEVREIKEDGAVYTIRCKLFYQKDGQWADRGVGNLHIKPVDDGRSQLIIRADTNLGNILLNILLSPSMPTKRQGKNNVFLVCVPNPPINLKEPSTDPTPMLIRVKTGEDADELCAKLEELKGSSAS